MYNNIAKEIYERLLKELNREPTEEEMENEYYDWYFKEISGGDDFINDEELLKIKG